MQLQTTTMDAGPELCLLPAVQVAYVDDGLEAIIFTADGDMRQALNNLQASCHPTLLCSPRALLSPSDTSTGSSWFCRGTLPC